MTDPLPPQGAEPPARRTPPENDRTALQTAGADSLDVVPVSPRWGVLTKFLVSLVFVVIVGAVLVRFQQMIAPLVLSVILAYLLRPLVEALTTRLNISWSAGAIIVYIALIVVLLTLITVAGFALFQQVQGLYNVAVDLFTGDLLARLQTIVSTPVNLGPLGTVNFSEPFRLGPFGPFQPINLSEGNWEPIINQLTAAVQPVLNRTGDLVTALASGTAATLGWALFILVVSFYLLNDLRNIGVSIERLVPDGYEYDAQRLVSELGPIWNAFLRGQITLGIVMGVVTWVVMTLLGVRYSVVLGLLAGLLEFIPVIGPFIAGAVAVLVALFQPANIWGLSPLAYAGLVLLVAILLQQVENNFLVPRILGGSLNLHPVVILVGALIAANLAGIIGLLLSAPIMATLRLFGGYVYRKMFDLDPWPDPPPRQRPTPEAKWARWLRRQANELWGERGYAAWRRVQNAGFNLRQRWRWARRGYPPPQPNPPNGGPASPPRVEYSYTIYWTKQVRQWTVERRQAVRVSLQAALAQPGFEANDYERRYRVPGLDDEAHAGASLVALGKVLDAFDENEDVERSEEDVKRND